VCRCHCSSREFSASSGMEVIMKVIHRFHDAFIVGIVASKLTRLVRPLTLCNEPKNGFFFLRLFYLHVPLLSFHQRLSHIILLRSNGNYVLTLEILSFSKYIQKRY
jgi:hypothetical protein